MTEFLQKITSSITGVFIAIVSISFGIGLIAESVGVFLVCLGGLLLFIILAQMYLIPNPPQIQKTNTETQKLQDVLKTIP